MGRQGRPLLRLWDEDGSGHLGVACGRVLVGSKGQAREGWVVRVRVLRWLLLLRELVHVHGLAVLLLAVPRRRGRRRERRARAAALVSGLARTKVHCGELRVLLLQEAEGRGRGRGVGRVSEGGDGREGVRRRARPARGTGVRGRHPAPENSTACGRAADDDRMLTQTISDNNDLDLDLGNPTQPRTSQPSHLAAPFRISNSQTAPRNVISAAKLTPDLPTP